MEAATISQDGQFGQNIQEDVIFLHWQLCIDVHCMLKLCPDVVEAILQRSSLRSPPFLSSEEMVTTQLLHQCMQGTRWQEQEL